jgi:hypothetical protein
VPDSTPITTYLRDHLAGSAVALDLLDKMREREGESELGVVLDDLRDDIAIDRAALEQVMDTLGVTSGAIRQAGGRVIEKVSRVKFDERVTGSAHLTHLMETEALSLGIEGKRSGWRALKEISPDDLGVDLDALIGRAEDQRARLEPFRLAAARHAFG